MTKFLPALLVALMLLTPIGTVLAQDNTTGEDCPACRNNNFYFIFVAAIIIFLVFFYYRNRAPVMNKPEKADEPDQREG